MYAFGYKIKQYFLDHGIRYFDVDLASKMPLSALCKKTVWHITHWSSCVVDVLKLGVPSIVVHEKGLETFRDYVEKKVVFFCSNETELAERIDEEINVDASTLCSEGGLGCREFQDLVIDFVNKL